jgi:hypothetical protein
VRLWIVSCLLTGVVQPAFGCKCVSGFTACNAVSSSDLVFIGTADSVEPKFLDPSDLSVQRRTRALFSEEELARMQGDKSPEGIAKLKAAYFKIYPDLPEPFKTELARATSSDELEAAFDSLLETGSRTHFKVKEVFRGPKTDALEIWSDFSDCGVHFQVGETYLVYAWRNKDRSRLETSACSRTKRVSDAGDDLAYLFFLANGGLESSRLSGFVTSDALNLRTPRFWDSVSHPVSDGFVELQSEHGTRRTETDRDGRFIFDGRVPGDYTVSAFDPHDDPADPRSLPASKTSRVPAAGCALEPILVVPSPPKQ